MTEHIIKEKTRFTKNTINTLQHITKDMMNNECIKYYVNKFNKHWLSNEISLKKLFDILLNKLINISNDKNINNINNHLIKKYEWSINKTKLEKEPYVYRNYKKKYDITYDEFKNLYNLHSIKLDNINYNKFFSKSFNISSDIIPILNDFEHGYFVSLDIKLYVENNINRCEYYSFDHMDMHFFYSNTLDNDTKNKIINNIYIISKWIYDLNPINNKKIKFYYFDTPLPKLINNNIDYISSENINSGSSISGIELMIWRREELNKVLIHELIHYLDLDIKNEDDIDNIIKYKIGKVSYPVLVNETITEMHAQFLHSIFITSKLNKNYFDNFKIIYQFETIFSWYQFSKIMNFYGIKKFSEEYLINNFNQSSNAFSYYILKCIFSFEFYNIISPVSYVSKLLNKTNDCNVDKCPIIVRYIDNILKYKQKDFLNNIINKLNCNFNKSLTMTIFDYNYL
jgi:hypothetical protein